MSYVSAFFTKSLHSKLEYPFHIMDWNYHTEDGWMRSTGNDEIIVECIGEEDRQKEGKGPFTKYVYKRRGVGGQKINFL